MKTSNSDFTVDFFLIGFPKTGTTALASCLAQHPDVCFSAMKEPFYHCTDLPGRRVITHETAYQKQFQPDHPHQLRGEATACYIYSPAALKRIHSRYPQAKIIIMLRNPLELIPSLHANQVRVFDESLTDLADAWHAQAERKAGKNIPKRCREPKFLDYATMAKQAHHIQQVIKYLPSHALLYHFLDDWKANPQDVFNRTCQFLGISTLPLPPQQRNSALSYTNQKHQTLASMIRLITQNPTLLRWKTNVGIPDLKTETWMRKKLMQEVKTPPQLSEALQSEIWNELKADVQQLEQLTQRSLTHWQP